MSVNVVIVISAKTIKIASLLEYSTQYGDYVSPVDNYFWKDWKLPKITFILNKYEYIDNTNSLNYRKRLKELKPNLNYS
jgi:hypothetical protein